MESLRARAVSSSLALFLLSPQGGEGRLLVSAVQSTLNAAVNASLSTLTRSLTSLTTLDRAVTEVAIRCRNLVALQKLLSTVAIPQAEEGIKEEGARGVLLDPVLTQLDTPALATSFFRSVAAGLEPRVRDVVSKGGANARILRGAKDRVRIGLRACVERGMIEGNVEKGEREGEFEAAVMVGAVGALGR